MFCASMIVGLHLATYHFSRVGYQEINPGVSVTCDEWQVGAYYNSYKKPAAYLAKNYNNVLGSSLDLALGVVVGYKIPILPAPILSYKYENVRFSLLPPIGGGGGVHMSYEF